MCPQKYILLTNVKVFCGCYCHTMPRTAKRKATFSYWYTRVNKSVPCHGLTVTETELEELLYGVLSKQAQVTQNVANLSNAGRLDIQLVEQAKHNKQIENHLDQKQALYEQVILKQITMEDYKTQKAAVDGELDQLRKIHSNLRVWTSQMEMDEKSKSARTDLAREVVGAGGMTAGLARMFAYPNTQVKIVWKMTDPFV